MALIDANGDGRIDLLVSSAGAASSKLGVLTSSLTVSASTISGGSQSTETLSANNWAGLSGYFSLQFGIGEWDSRLFHRYDFAPSFSLKDPEVRLIDLNGDGTIDALRTASGSYLECFYNDSVEGWNETRLVARKPLENFPNITFSDSRVKLADMTGDGLQDIVLVYDGSIILLALYGMGKLG